MVPGDSCLLWEPHCAQEVAGYSHRTLVWYSLSVTQGAKKHTFMGAEHLLGRATCAVPVASLLPRAAGSVSMS